MSTPEGKVKDALRKVLKKHDVWYFSPVSRGLGKHGIPDFVCCFGGRFLGFEAKALDGMQPTTLQKLCMADITNHGGYCMTVTPDAIDVVDAWLTHNKGKFL